MKPSFIPSLRGTGRAWILGPLVLLVSCATSIAFCPDASQARAVLQPPQGTIEVGGGILRGSGGPPTHQSLLLAPTPESTPLRPPYHLLAPTATSEHTSTPSDTPVLTDTPTPGESDTPTPTGTIERSRLIYSGERAVTGSSAAIVGEIDARITGGDHIELKLPFTNEGRTAIDSATFQLAGATSRGTTAGASIYREGVWYADGELLTWSLGSVAVGATVTPIIWIYVTDIDPYLTREPPAQTWIDISTDSGKWRVVISLESVSFTDAVVGNDNMEAASCLHHPSDPSIQRYAQYAAGACRKLDDSSLAEVCQPATTPSQVGDPDTPAQAVRNVVARVNSEFHYQSNRYSYRQLDTILLLNRDGGIGECRDYSDLTVALLRSLNLPTRTVTALLELRPTIQNPWPDVGGHAWTEAYIPDGAGPDWKQADSTWRMAINRQGAYEDNPRFKRLTHAWADLYPLSSASPYSNAQYRCIAPCYEHPVNCSACRNESRKTRTSLFPELSCVADVTSVYHGNVGAVAQRPLASGGLLLSLDSPSTVTQGEPFTVSTTVTNDTSALLSAITATISQREYVDSTSPTFDVVPPFRVLEDLPAGATADLSWTVTPRLAASGIPLRFSATSDDLFDSIEVPLAANEPGTLPDLSLTGICGPGKVLPGDEVVLTASVLDDRLESIVDAGTVVTADVIAMPPSEFSTALVLPFCSSCEAYQGSFTLPDTAPAGEYVVNFAAIHPGFDQAAATGGFFVAPPLTLSLSTDRSMVGVLDTVLVSGQLLSRGAGVAGAGASAEILTPNGAVRVPLVEDEYGGLYSFALRPADLAANLSGRIVSGGWDVSASAAYLGASISGETSFTVVASFPLAEVAIARSEDAVMLAWPHMGSGAGHYEVYRSGTPYFTLDAGDLVKIGSDIPPAPRAGDWQMASDPDAAVQPASSYYYQVWPVDTDGQYYPKSNCTGVFSFALQPGV